MRSGVLTAEVREEAAEVHVSVAETTGTRHAHDGDSRCGRTFCLLFDICCLLWTLAFVLDFVLDSNASDANETASNKRCNYATSLAGSVGLHSQSKWLHRSQSLSLAAFAIIR